jgi:hypothetical protein
MKQRMKIKQIRKRKKDDNKAMIFEMISNQQNLRK